MNKKISKIKRVFTLCLIFLLSINSFAAIVGDNDGSAFITKAEFDALKSSFQAQIASYNQSIDSKIDGAIAAYLSGIKISREEVVNLPYNTQEKVTCMNYIPSLSYAYPDIDLSNSLLAQMWDPGAAWIQCWWLYSSFKYENSDKNVVLLCDDKNASTTSPADVKWNGRSVDLKCVISASFIGNITSTSYTKGYLQSSSLGNFYIHDILNLEPGIYKTALNKATDFWKVKSYYSQNTDNSGDRVIANYYSNSGTMSASLNQDVYGKTTDYDHVIHYNTINDLHMHSVNWFNKIAKMPDTTKKISTWLKDTKFTKSGIWSDVESNGNNRIYKSRSAVAGYYAGDERTSTSGDAIVASSLCYVDAYDSTKVYQNNDKYSTIVDDDVFEVENPNLLGGFICLSEKKGNRVKWQPVFTNRIVDGTASNFELNVELALAPFGEGHTVDASTIIRCPGQVDDYLTTSGGKCSFDFTMPEDGTIYCKWWPNDTTILGKKWEASIDLALCGSYVRVKAD